MNDNDAKPNAERLAALRGRIDELDERLHEALIERSAIIDELIVAKGSRASAGAIFRPGREAQMMRRLVDRHRGSLPLRDIEHLWHVIIASHTALQAPFEVFVDVSGDPLPSWDAARLVVGFAVPVSPCGSAEMVIEAMNEALNEGRASLGLLPVNATSGWWASLGDRLRIMARTPSITLPDDRSVGGAPADVQERHDARAPHWVVAPVLSDPVPFDVPLSRVRVPEGLERPDGVIDAIPADGSEWWLVEGEQNAAVRDAALDTVDCGGYHRAAALPT